MGAGSWGTTFGQVLCDAGTAAVLYARRPDLARVIGQRHENPDYLPGIALTPALDATADPARALAGADVVVFAVPAQTLRANLADWAPLVPPGALLVSLIKGIELGTSMRMSEVITSVLAADAARVAVVSGPNLAREIVRRQIAATVVASVSPAAALALQEACHTPYFRPYTNTDVTGCELGGAVKNIIAIAVGIAVAMGLGDNTKATLITRGLAEIARLGSALGAQAQTFAGPRRHGRPGGHLFLAAVAEPDARREPGPGHVGGGGRGGHRPDRRGRGLVRAGAQAGPRPRRGDADHRGGRGGHAGRAAGRAGRLDASVTVSQTGVVRAMRDELPWT